jgi:hypothetical protein
MEISRPKGFATTRGKINTKPAPKMGIKIKRDKTNGLKKELSIESKYL